MAGEKEYSMNGSGKWTRRQFSQALAVTAASSLLVRKSPALPLPSRSSFAFAGFSGSEPAQGTVRVFRTCLPGWREVEAVQAASPASLVMHPAASMLYIVHDVAEWEHRPRGAVSAYRFHPGSGRLRHAGTQPLSLSATNPRQAILVAGGAALFVAAETGGIYNVLPIAADGTLQPVSAIRKEFGMEDGPTRKTSAPRHLTSLPGGDVYASDPGKETISRFTISRDAITLRDRSRMYMGASPLFSNFVPRSLGEEDGLRSSGHALVNGASSLLIHLV